ncbi:cobalamin-independent methionine synthase II family protein [Flaviflexus equikiangi]|nr:cobalamin-independent methionine synthase II family protein [Flaviflexus equikiangi]
MILTTHAGSLPRTERLFEANQADMPMSDPAGYASLLSEEVAVIVQRQRDAGIDIVGDGEYGKFMSKSVDYAAWWSYSYARTGGLEIIEGDDSWLTKVHHSTPDDIQLAGFGQRRDFNRFLDAYFGPNATVEMGSSKAQPTATGPLSYIGQDAATADASNLVAALAAAGRPADTGFVTAIAPGSAARISNAYYGSEEEFIKAWIPVLREEYKTILDAGLLLQLDDPSLAESYDQITPEIDPKDYVRFIRTRVDAVNEALEGLDRSRVRYHLCWGSWHGPHTTDLEFENIVDAMLDIDVAQYSFEAGNVRHEHEWRVWENRDLGGRTILPGVVSHATNVVEHPQLVADRLVRFARLVGEDHVIGSSDCGFGGRIHPQIAWAKLEALSEGAALASDQL